MDSGLSERLRVETHARWFTRYLRRNDDIAVIEISSCDNQQLEMTVRSAGDAFCKSLCTSAIVPITNTGGWARALVCDSGNGGESCLHDLKREPPLSRQRTISHSVSLSAAWGADELMTGNVPEKLSIELLARSGQSTTPQFQASGSAAAPPVRPSEPRWFVRLVLLAVGAYRSEPRRHEPSSDGRDGVGSRPGGATREGDDRPHNRDGQGDGAGMTGYQAPIFSESFAVP